VETVMSVRDLPPSAKLVLKVLEVEGAHDKPELVECTGLPESTARYAAERLIDEGLVEKRIRDDDIVYDLA
jgi:DNA-binding IclR family transcriptional regulator